MSEQQLLAAPPVARPWRLRQDFAVLFAAVALSLALGAANNALNPARVAWVGSPEVIPNPFDLEHDPHAVGALKGVKYAAKELGKQAVPVALGAGVLLALSVFWRRRGAAWGQILETWFRLGIAAMFLAACWPKLRSPADFASAVAQYRLLPPPLVNAFSLFLPALELVAALGLVFTRSTREFYLLVTVLWAMFIGALGQALYRRLGITCGCFAIEGISGSVGETWFSLLRDLVLIGPTAVLAAAAQNRWFWRASPRDQHAD